MVRGQLVRFGVVAAVVLGAVWAQEASGPAEEDCCHGDFRDDLDPGLGLLAEPRVVVTVRRASLSLDCAIASEPQLGNLTYMWRLRGDEIHSRSPKGRRYVHPNGTLHIRKVAHRVKGKLKMSDEGMYECYVTNSVGTVLAQRLQLFIASLGRNFTVEPRGGMVGVGESFYLPCQIQASPHDLMVVWEKDASLLKVDDNPRYIPMEGGLLIVDAQVGDSGTYQCQVTNKNFYNFVHDDMPSSPQWRNSRPATLVVTNNTRPQVAHFLLTPRNVTSVLVGDSVDLQCVPRVFHPHTISWIRTVESDPNTVLPIETSADFTLLPWGSLRIHRASRDHVGTYTCSHIHSAVSVSSKLIVLEEPVIQDSSISRVYPLASIMRLSCLVAGQPPPSIRWLKNGEEVVPVRYRVEFLKEALVIYQGNQGDSGYYQCLVENEAGWALSLTRIAVRVEPDAPSPPYNVTGEAISSSRVRVRWEMEPSAENLLSFTVHKRLAHEEGGEVVGIVDSQNRQTVLVGLTPDTLYAITVRAYNKHGASPSSHPIYIRTDLTGFPALTLSYISNSSISLDWSDFHIRHRRKDDIASYKVYYGLSSSEQVDEVTVDANQDRLLLTDLEENREYRVRMMATFKGDRPGVHDESWPWSYIRTGNISLPAAQRHLAAPYNLDAQPLKPDAVALSWMYSAKGLSAALPVTHYTVRCEALESMVLEGHCKGIATQSLILKTSHSNIATVDNLQPFTLYNISVSAHSDDIQGPYSHPILVQTKEDVPSRPENLEAEVVSEGQVRLQWQPPTWPNGLIQGHFIQYVNQQHRAHREVNIITRSDLANITWIQLYQRGNMTQATVGNLTQRVYLFQVMACTNAGRGAPSTLVFVHMGEGSLKSGLSDQHLGILGGSVIGLTSIMITVVVIVCKQRQLQKQLESRVRLEQGRQPSPRPHDLQSQSSVTSHLSPSTVQSEELEQLLDPRPYPTAAPIPTMDRDSGCSSTPPPMEEGEEAADDIGDEIRCLMEGRAACMAAGSVGAMSVRNCEEIGFEHRETTC